MTGTVFGVAYSAGKHCLHNETNDTKLSKVLYSNDLRVIMNGTKLSKVLYSNDLGFS